MACPTGDCCSDLDLLLDAGLNTCWPSARSQIYNALRYLQALVCEDCIREVPLPLTQEDFMEQGWGAGRPSQDTCPLMWVINGCNIWVGVNDPSCDLGTDPSTPGTGIDWRQIGGGSGGCVFTPVAADWCFEPILPSDICDAVDALASRKWTTTRLRAPANVTVPSANPLTTVIGLTIDEDTIGGGAPTGFTVPAGAGGLYTIRATSALVVPATNTPTGSAGVHILRNGVVDPYINSNYGANIINNASLSYGMTTEATLELNVGDVIQIALRQSNLPGNGTRDFVTPTLQIIRWPICKGP